MSGNVTVIDIVAQVTDETASGARSAEKNVSKLEKAMQSVQQRINDMRGKSKLEIAASLKDMASSGLQKIAEKGKSLAGKAWTVTMKLKDLVTAPFRGIAKMLANPIVQIATITGVSLGVKDTIDTYKTFQQGMANVKAISNASEKDMTALTATAKELGETTMFSASQAAEAMENLAMAGWKAENIIKGMPGLLDLAAAGSVDLATASDVVSSAIAQFRLEADESARIANVLAATATNSKTDVQGLGESLKYAGTMAGSLGYTIEDTALALGLMGNAGVDASSAGSSLRMIFARMSKQEGMTAEESNAVAEAMKKVGVSLTDSKGKMKTMLEVMNELRTGFSKLDEAEKAATASNLAGTYSMTGLLAIVNATDDKFEELTEAIKNSEGAAARMANIKMDTLQGSMYYLQSAAEGVKIEIGQKLEPYLRGFIDWFTSKMPSIKTVALDAMDFLGTKIQSVQKKIEEMTQSNAWKGATTLWDKIKVAWNKIIAEPFDEWWSSSGRAWLSEKANGVGKFMGNFLKTGLLTLFGVDVGEVLNEGMAVGKSFVDGFLKGFDTKKVLEGVKKIFRSITSDAFSGSDTSGLSAALLGIGALKVGSAGANIVKGGKTIFDGAKGITGAIKGLGTSAAGTAGAALTHSAAAAATHTAAPSALATAAGGQAAWAAGAGAGASLLPYLGVLAGAAVVIGGVTLAVKANNDAMVKARKEFTESMLFNNGGTKLADFTSQLKASTSETYNLAKKINYTNAELSGIEAQMQDAATSIKFFGTSLRETGTLSQKEAENMYEPFNQLCTSLEKDFKTRYEVVFEAFKGASGSVAQSLGGDIAAISTMLDQFKEHYLGSINTSQNKVNGYLERGMNGEQFSSEEISDMEAEIQKLMNYANAEKSKSQYEFEQKVSSIGKMDFGEDHYAAMSALGDLNEYKSSYISELSEAMKNVNFQSENLRGNLQAYFDNGEVSENQYKNYLAAINAAQAISLAAFESKKTEMEETMSELQRTLREQVDNSVIASVDSKGLSFWDNYIGTLGAWGDVVKNKGFSMDAQQSIARGNAINSAREGWLDIYDEINNLGKSTKAVEMDIPVDVNLYVGQINSGTFNASSIFSALGITAAAAEYAEAKPHASGGIMTRPHLGLVAEDGAEAIIPLSGKRRERGLSLWKETGRMLGVHEYAEGGIIGAIPPIGISSSGGSVDNSTNITVELGSFNISVDSSASSDEIMEIIRANITNLTDEVANELAEKLRAVFVNMPLKAIG